MVKLGLPCAINGCHNHKRHHSYNKSFFRMPRDPDRLKSWIAACRRDDLDLLLKSKDTNYFYNSYVVCSDHFQSECFRNKNLFSQGLLPWSVPTLKLYQGQASIKRKISDRSEEVEALNEKRERTIEFLNAVFVPRCSASNCIERAGGHVQVFQLPDGPENAERRQQWIHNINRENWKPKRAILCEKHFTNDQFENDLENNKKVLRWNAVPTLLLHEEREAEIDKEIQMEGKAQFISNLPIDLTIEDSLNINAEEESQYLFDQHDINSNNSVQEETNPRILELQEKLQLAQETITKLNEESETLKAEFNTIFNEDQIEYLKRKRVAYHQWQSDTIKKSRRLYLLCGATGYEELRKQKYPLPAICTLQS